MLPLGLQCLVYATWKFRDATLPSCGSSIERKAKDHTDAPAEPARHTETPDDTENAEMERETTASRFGDHYFALFLICESTPSFACNALRCCSTAR